jgi:hypothetical protein
MELVNKIWNCLTKHETGEFYLYFPHLLTDLREIRWELSAHSSVEYYEFNLKTANVENMVSSW